MKTCIYRQFHGGSEQLNFEDFAMQVIQDDSVAIDIANQMLDDPDSEYSYNEDEAEFYETFSIVDADALRQQLEQEQQE